MYMSSFHMIRSGIGTRISWTKSHFKSEKKFKALRLQKFNYVLNNFNCSGVGSVWRQFLLAHLSTGSNWITVQTGVHGFDSRTPHKPVA